MPFRAYLEIDPPGAPFEDLVTLTRRWDERSYRGLAADSAAYDRLMDAPTAACRDAAPPGGRFPLVVYSAGWFNRVPDNTVLSELLASHGFVVATVPQTNPGLWTFDFRSDAASVEAQVRDLEVAVGVLTAQPMVDRRTVIAMGYSTGGDVALLLQARNPLIDAVVGLDSSWSLGSDNDVATSPFFAAEKHDVPVLVARRPTSDEGRDEVLDLLTSAPRIVVDIPAADHGSFADDNIQRYFLGEHLPAYRSAHAVAVLTVLDFLNAVTIPDAGFDGPALAELLRKRGLEAAFLPAAARAEADTGTETR